MLKKGQLVLISVKCLQAIINNTFDKHAIDTFATHIFQADTLSIPGSSGEAKMLNLSGLMVIVLLQFALGRNY